MNFTVFPAIDMRQGRCVRLRQGKQEDETVYSENPADMANHWQELGAEWLHVVNLDGAFDSDGVHAGPNYEALLAILRVAQVPVQFGGGVRSLAIAEHLLSLGVRRVILGTGAVQNPDLVSTALRQFGSDRVIVSLDTRDGMVATHGWQKDSGISAIDLGRKLAAMGLKIVVNTDISRDCMLAGANITTAVTLAAQTGLQVIVSGGVAGIQDVELAASNYAHGLAGVITGQALYTGVLNLREAIAVARRASGKYES